MPSKKERPEDKYTDPKLHERIKQAILAGDRGGNPGEWSARKAQLTTLEYKRQGGGFKGNPTASQQHLKEWTAEHWTTSDGKPARRATGTARYLPEKAWQELTPAEKASTNKKKREGSKEGKQFVANTAAASKARKKTTK